MLASVSVSRSKLCPLFWMRVPAGFPSPAQDAVQEPLDLNSYLIDHPAATYFVRVTGDSMQGAGIHEGDLLIVDRSISVRQNQIVVASLDGEFMVKRLVWHAQQVQLVSENPKYSPIKVRSSDFSVWGVVRHVIHEVC